MWRQFLFLCILLVTSDLWVKVTVAVMLVPYNNVKGKVPKDGPSREETFLISSKDETNIQHVATVIEAFEKLGVLNPSQENCYSLEKIVRKLEEGEEGEEWRIAVFLYVRDLGKGQTGVKTDSPQTDDKQAIVTSRGYADHVTSNGVTVYPPDGPTGVSPSSPNSEACILKTLASLNDGVKNNSSNDTVMTAWPSNGKDSDGVAMGNMTSNEEVIKEKTDEVDGGARLSRTQVMVISTCSTVIGVFFIVAVMMRIRNYIKRVREEQAATRRPSFRECSMGLRSNNSQDKDGRLEAALNKDRDNVAMAITRKDADEELDGNMSKYGKQENRPLLIVTAASTPSSPNTQRGDSDYQYSNRDDDDVMTADEQGCHDTPCLPRQDVYGVPLQKDKGFNRAGEAVPPDSRQKPLKSCMKQHSDRPQSVSNNGRPPLRSQPSVTETGFMEVDCDIDRVGRTAGGPSECTSVIKPVGILKNSGGNDVSRLVRCDSNGSVNRRAAKSSSRDLKPERLLDFGGNEGECPDEDDTEDYEVVGPPEYDTLERESYRRRDLDIEYSSGNDCSAETANLVPQLTPHHLETNIDDVTVTATGFTQSDSSISSTNPSYRYGNQVEYTGVHQYGNTVYFPDERDEDGVSVMVELIDDEADDTTSASLLSSRPVNARQNSDDTTTSGRRMSSDSLTYNESPRHYGNHVGLPRDLSDDGSDWADDNLHEGNNLAYEDERAVCKLSGFRDERLPYIKEYEDDDTECEPQINENREDVNTSGQGRQKTTDITSYPTVKSTTRRRRRLQRNGRVTATEGTETIGQDPGCLKEESLSGDEEGEDGSSDSETCENVSTSLLPPSPTDPKRPKAKARGCTEWSLLLDPAFEGMEPTYV